ncbi:unnamed protein product [Pseudo-nitzschia multistriata]|uniref:Uncharacterized protein n=1 Tax=Pseudo-nitzschia multistriata TaxID=183589 RepID=A0A448ZM37_9STRA|nr:unnamed protein product [Pseudo-nitzschia multistriata]
MNFSKIAVAALSFNCSPWFVQGDHDEIKHKVGPWELHPIGNDDTGTTFAFINTGDGADPMIDVVLHVEGDFGSTPTIEVFTGGKESEACDLGNKIVDGHEGYTYEFKGISSGSPYDDLRVTSDGSIGQAVFKMKLHDDLAWTIRNSDNPNIGTFKACARVSKKHDNEYISFVDTLVKVHFDAEGRFDTDFSIVGTSIMSLEQNEKETVELDSYLCGQSDSGNPEREYKVGQSFSICVGPTNAEKEKYDYVAVVGFENVQCGPAKVVVDGIATALTQVNTNPQEYRKADEPVESGVSSFGTVVTPGYYSADKPTATCSGTVKLSFTNPKPLLQYEKVGCGFIRNDPMEQYPLDSGGTEDDVKRCNDHCSDGGYEYFILGCPHTMVDDSPPEFFCVCTSGHDLEVTSETCPGSETGINFCNPELVEDSLYEWAVSDHDLAFAVYDVTPPNRRLTGSFMSAVYKVTPPNRRLTASFSTNSGDLLQRHLQESGNKADTSGSFGTEVLLSREENVDAAFGGLAAPAADTGAVPTTVTATAVGAFVAAAASLV